VKIKIFFVMLLAVISLYGSVSSAEEFNCPQVKNLWDSFKNPFKENGQYSKLSSYRPIFTIFGSNGKGKIAYVMESYDDGRGYAYSWNVFDLVNDKIVWSKGIAEDSLIAFKRKIKNAEEGSKDFFRQMFEIKLKEYMPDLKKYGIKPVNKGNMHVFPMTYKGSRFSCRVEMNRTKSEMFGLDVVNTYKIKVFKKSKKGLFKKARSKTVSSADFINKKHNGLLDVQVLGCMASPYESRAAVVVAKIHRGWEGPPHEIGISIVGCSLKVGFK